jgi:hypothetical protein
MKIENDQDFLKMKEVSFKEFKELMRFTSPQLSDAVNTTIAVRSHLELAMSQSWNTTVDAHKKHQWLNQKLSDLLKTNSILLMRQAVEKQIAEVKAKASTQPGTET